MNDIEAAVLRILSSHRGRPLPITSQAIVQRLGGTVDRSVRLAIRKLITLGYPIASATDSPAGYYIAETWEEVTQYAQTLRARLIQDAIRRRDFIRAAKTRVEPKQLELIVK